MLAIVTVIVAGCSTNKDEAYAPGFAPALASTVPEYIFAVLPVNNPKHLFEVYGPLIDHLNSRIPDAHFQFQASRSFADFEKNLYSRRFHFALPNPYETVNALSHGYHVFAKMGDDDTFRGVILVRRDGNIQRIPDLAGKTVSFPAPTALAAALMPQLYLHTHGIDVNRDIKLLYSGSHESTIMNVHLGNAAAGSVWLPMWQAFARNNPDIASQLEVRWQTDTLPNNGLVVRDDIPAGLTQRVKAVMLSLHQSEAGRAILAGIGTSRFETADDSRYDPVRAFIRQFSLQVRPLVAGS
jgi:phosphonate transport system substrate-binding protein